ncbi:hypothetical protein [Spongiimicrobium salis]|uniref:hypothetical protein n=1 Tax=Spongiimicrobium salis TaxID=1667022 RepID=UPI00374D8CFB
MSKLYVFGIGGSGSRILKSLTMLLASGVYANTERIVPMIIDTDVNNGDLNHFRDTIKLYNKIRSAAFKDATVEDENNTKFFRTQIDEPKELNISGSTYETLAKMIEYTTLPSNELSKTKALVELLFGTKALHMNLEKGFLGSPNVGSIVLRDVVNTKGFREFAQKIQSGDRIFILSSIFGGTGAAGFPLLLNLFRDETSNLPNAKYIKEAIIGGISLMPYFEVDKSKYDTGESAINSNTFVTKTKAALTYYNRYLTKNLDALFYIGDYRRSSYENNDGGTQQKNPANFIEFASALSILKFLNYDKKAETRNMLEKPIKYFEFGVENDASILDLNHLGGSKDTMVKSLIKFMYFNLYNTNFLKKALKDRRMTWHRTLETPGNFAESTFVNGLYHFASTYFYRWLYEMGLDVHARKFVPFNLNISNEEELKEQPSAGIELDLSRKDALFNIVRDIKPVRSNSTFKRDNIDPDTILNHMADKLESKDSKDAIASNFLSLLHAMVENIYETRFNN